MIFVTVLMRPIYSVNATHIREIVTVITDPFQWFAERYEKMSWVCGLGILHARSAIVPILTTQTFVTNAADIRVTAIADGLLIYSDGWDLIGIDSVVNSVPFVICKNIFARRGTRNVGSLFLRLLSIAV